MVKASVLEKGGINAFYKCFIICVNSVLKSKNSELTLT